MLTVNALAAANRIIIPVQAEYLPAKGLEQLLSTVGELDVAPRQRRTYALGFTSADFCPQAKELLVNVAYGFIPEYIKQGYDRVLQTEYQLLYIFI